MTRTPTNTLVVSPTPTVTNTPTLTPTPSVPAGQVWKFYYYAGSVRIATRSARGHVCVQSTTNNQIFYLFGDHLGSTSLSLRDASRVVDSSGNPVSEQRYKAWGELRYEWGTTVSEYTYTGQRAEAGLGLMFYNARWYDPLTGRFAQADSIVPQPGNPLAWDRYIYVIGNPISILIQQVILVWFLMARTAS